jgi:hypothetical protein
VHFVTVFSGGHFAKYWWCEIRLATFSNHLVAAGFTSQTFLVTITLIKKYNAFMVEKTLSQLPSVFVNRQSVGDLWKIFGPPASGDFAP